MMDSIQTLRKLVDEEAIAFIKANENDYDIQFNEFLKLNSTHNVTNINGQKYFYGIDLAKGKDMTVYTPPLNCL